MSSHPTMEPPASEALLRPFAGVGAAVDLCVVIVNYNTAHLLERCIGRLRLASRDIAVRVVIVDNASRDGSVAFIREHFPDCVLIPNKENVGFGRANNQALEFCDSPYLLLLNADAYVCPGTLVKSLAHMYAHPRCGVLGVRLTNEAGQSSYRGRPFPDTWTNFLVQTGLWRLFRLRPSVNADTDDPAGGAWPCDWVVGCFYLTRREVIEQIGLFDPRYFLYFEEVDHCRAVKEAGWDVECLAGTSVIHVGGGSAESEGGLSVSGRQISALQTESELLYYRKHNGLPGLLATVSLALLADAIRAFKWIAKGRRLAGVGVFWRNSVMVCRLAWQTRLGTRATR